MCCEASHCVGICRKALDGFGDVLLDRAVPLLDPFQHRGIGVRRKLEEVW